MTGTLFYMLSLAAVLNGQPSRSSNEHFVDLVAASLAVPPAAVVPLERQLTPDVTLSIATHEPPLAPFATIAIDAPSLDRTVYQIGDDVVFEVTLVNAGKTAVEFPVLADAGRIDRDMPGASVAAIALRFEDDALGSQQVGYQALYGAESVPDSLMTVHPGDRVRIRVPGKWFLISGSKRQMFPPWQRDLRVRAQLQFKRGTRFLEVLSAKSVAIRLGQ